MNYRHHFHAGNFADVMKHVLLVQLLRAMQKKEKGFLFLDTHAGRGAYDLAASARGDSLARAPEWPAGIGRVWSAAELPETVADYRELVRRFDRDEGNAGEGVRFYPGSPAIARQILRMQDRAALCEKHPEEFEALADRFRFAPRTAVHPIDGYGAVRAMLPPVERRALVLIDPPFEAMNEFAQIVEALRDGLARLAGGVFAVWYPLTERARIDAFFGDLRALSLPPTLAIELTIAGEQSPLKMRGCGLLLVNPPWKFESTAREATEALRELLAQEAGGAARLEWLVPER